MKLDILRCAFGKPQIIKPPNETFRTNHAVTRTMRPFTGLLLPQPFTGLETATKPRRTKPYALAGTQSLAARPCSPIYPEIAI